MRILLLIPIFIFSKNLNAQNISFKIHLDIAMSLDKVEDSRAYLDSIINVSANKITTDTIALFQHKIGLKYFQNQEYKKAIQYTLYAAKKRAELIKSNDNLKYDLAQSYNNIGGYYRSLSEETQNLLYTDSTIFYFNEVIKIGSHPKNFNYPNACRELGMEYGSRSDYNKSLNAFQTGVDFLKVLDSLDYYFTIDLAKIYLDREDIYQKYSAQKPIIERLDEMRWASQNLEIIEKYPELALSHGKLALLYEELGQTDSTIISFKNTIYWHEELLKVEYDDRAPQWRRRLGATWNNFGNYYIRQNNFSEALKCFDKSLKIKEERYGIELHPEKCSYYVNVGECYQKQNKIPQATQFFHTAISHLIPDFKTKNLSAQPNNAQLELSSRKADLLYVLERKGEALIALKETDTALQTFATADRLIDIMRKGHSESGSKLFWREKTCGLYEKALDLTYQKKNTKQAFYFFEKSKSVLLLDALNASEARQLLPDSLAQREMNLLQVSDAAREAAAQDKTKHPNYIKTNTELKDFQKDLAEKYPKYYATRYEIAVGNLEENGDIYSYQNKTQYIHFFYGENHIYAMIFGAGKSKLTRTTRNEQTDALIEKYLQQFSSPNIITNDPEAYNKIASQVYDLLLSPLFPNGQLPEELVLLPDNFLNVLPFDALKSQENSDYLLQQTNIRYAYSISVLKNQQSINKQKIKTLGLAPFTNSNDSLSLNYSANELAMAEKKVQGLFAKENTASKSFFLENAPNYQFLHLSTHAREKGENGNPEIFFADEKLDLSKLYSTEFNNNLVILSACETGLGKVKKGEGVLSLNRGFTYAGAKSIISSLWRVNDKSTSDILSNFYANLNDKTTKSKALHLAKKDFIQNANILFQSPYYWAGLTYSGSDGTVVLERNSSWKFLLLGGGVLIILSLLFLRKRITNATSNQ